MKTVFGVIGSVLAFLLVVFAFVWIVQGNDFFMYKFFGPKYEKARRQIFEETKSYRQGMIQEIRHAKMEYEGTDDIKKKESVASFILHSTADFPEEDMPSDIRGFMSTLRNNKKY